MRYTTNTKSSDVINFIKKVPLLFQFNLLAFKVLSVVGIDLFNRYDSLLLRDSLNMMDDLVYCPRWNCNCAVIPVYSLFYLRKVQILQS